MTPAPRLCSSNTLGTSRPTFSRAPFILEAGVSVHIRLRRNGNKLSSIQDKTQTKERRKKPVTTRRRIVPPVRVLWGRD